MTCGGINRYAAIGRNRSGSKRQGRNMTFPDSAKAQDEATTALRCTGLIRMGDDARIEQCRRFEGIFVQKIGSDQLTLYPGENRMCRKGVFHFFGARLESTQEIAVAVLEMLKDIRQLTGRHLGIERQNSINDMVRPRLINGVEVPRLG